MRAFLLPLLALFFGIGLRDAAAGPSRKVAAPQKHSALAAEISAKGFKAKRLGAHTLLIREGDFGYVLDTGTPGLMRLELPFSTDALKGKAHDDFIGFLAALNRERRWVSLSYQPKGKRTTLRIDQAVESDAQLLELLPKALRFLETIAPDLPFPPVRRAVYRHDGDAAPGISAAVSAAAAAPPLGGLERMKRLLDAEGIRTSVDKDGDLSFIVTGVHYFIAVDKDASDFLRVAAQYSYDGDPLQQRAACNKVNALVVLSKCTPIDAQTTMFNAEQYLPASSHGAAQFRAAMVALARAHDAFNEALAATSTKSAR